MVNKKNIAARSTLIFPFDAPVLLLYFILATGFNNCFATLSGCYMPEDLVDAIKGSLQLKLNPNESAIRPYINVTRFRSQGECPQKMKSIGLKVDNLTEVTRDISNVREDFYEELFKEIDDFEQISSYITQNDMADVKTLLKSVREKSLKGRRLPRQIADLVNAGKSEEAKEIFKDTDANMRAELMIKTMKIVYDEGILQTAILFAYNIGYFDASLAGFKILLNEMKRNSQLENLEVLLLQFCISNDILHSNFASQTTEVKDEYLKLQTEVDVFVAKIIPVLVAEIDQKSYSKRDDVAKRLGYNVLDMFLPKIISKYYTPGTLTQATELINYITNSGYISSICVAEEALYHEMEKRNQLTSFEAFNHWLYVRRTIYLEKNYKNVNEMRKESCQKIHDLQKDNAIESTNKFIQEYDSDDWSQIKEWISAYPYTLRWMLQDVVTLKYNGNWENINKLTKLVGKFNSWDADCIGPGTLALEMQKFNKLGTFEMVPTYKTISSTMEKYIPRNDTRDYHTFCEKAKEIAPPWIQSLIFKDSSSCKIINRDDLSVLAVLGVSSYVSTEKSIVTKSSGGDETRWKIEVADNGVVSFQNVRYPDTYISLTEGEDDAKASSKFWWRVEGSSDGYMRIHAKDESRKDFYFVTREAEDCKNIESCVKVAKRNNSNEKFEWKISC